MAQKNCEGRNKEHQDEHIQHRDGDMTEDEYKALESVVSMLEDGWESARMTLLGL